MIYNQIQRGNRRSRVDPRGAVRKRTDWDGGRPHPNVGAPTLRAPVGLLAHIGPFDSPVDSGPHDWPV